jgi:serine/threonine-protein kinase RsbW
MSSATATASVRTRRVTEMQPLELRSSDVRLTLPARPENVAVIRHVLGALADALNLPADVVDDMRLAVTEACTNVVRHAYDGEPGRLDIVLRPDGEDIEVIVSDYGRGLSASADTDGPGLGLALISALAASLDIQHAPSAGSRLAMSFLGRPRVGAA